MNFPNISFHRIHGLGQHGIQRNRAADLVDQGRPELDPRRAHHEVRLRFESQRANGFGAAEHLRPGELSASSKPPFRARLSVTSGSSFASFLLGTPTAAQPRPSATCRRPTTITASMRRTIGASPKRLTVNFGLRYEFTLPPVAGGDQYADFSPTTPNPAVNNYPGRADLRRERAGPARARAAWFRAGTADGGRAWASLTR